MEFVIFIAFSIQFSALENPSMHPVEQPVRTVGSVRPPRGPITAVRVDCDIVRVLGTILQG